MQRHYFFLYVIVLLVGVFALASRARSQQPVSSSGCGCPIPRLDTVANVGPLPTDMDMRQKVSPDGRYLAYSDWGALFILNLRTLEEKMIGSGKLSRLDIISSGVLTLPIFSCSKEVTRWIIMECTLIGFQLKSIKR
jgi:hypothetical protein